MALTAASSLGKWPQLRTALRSFHEAKFVERHNRWTMQV